MLDGMDGAIHHRYGYMPNMVYVIDKAGKVMYKANWTDSPVVDQILTELHAEESKVEGTSRRLTLSNEDRDCMRHGLV